MATRIMEIRRLLKPPGSLYLQCEPTASHYLKTLMGAVFRYANFLNRIVWNLRCLAKSKRFQWMLFA